MRFAADASLRANFANLSREWVDHIFSTRLTGMYVRGDARGHVRYTYVVQIVWI